MTDPYFFGYGSLVNRRTHEYAAPRRAHVTGWRRAWRHSPLRPVSFLTVLPCDGARIAGLTAAVPGSDWAALDLREAAYRRQLTLAHHDDGPLDGVAIYAIPDGHHHDPGEDNPVLLSYLDVVVQGFLAEFGPEGVMDFFDTTDGWSAPILDDRAAPRYPRHQTLTEEERALVHDGLARVGARIVKA